MYPKNLRRLHSLVDRFVGTSGLFSERNNLFNAPVHFICVVIFVFLLIQSKIVKCFDCAVLVLPLFWATKKGVEQNIGC